MTTSADPLALQGHYLAPPGTVEPSTPQAATPSLAGTSVTHEVDRSEQCPNGSWFRGICADHGNTRWAYHPCKKRSCLVCGPKRRAKVAYRIAHGVEQLAGPLGATWFVGTWAEDVTKDQAVKAVTRFIAWVRRHQPERVEYASTWELTRQGRLHVNVVFAPWSYLHWTNLVTAWKRVGGGRVVWVKRVGEGIGVEAAKSRQDLSDYVTKHDQLPPYGKAACFSRAWPKPPQPPPLTRKGTIHWQPESITDSHINGVSEFAYEKQLGFWSQNEQEEWFNDYEEPCDCFDYGEHVTLSLPPPEVSNAPRLFK